MRSKSAAVVEYFWSCGIEQSFVCLEIWDELVADCPQTTTDQSRLARQEAVPRVKSRTQADKENIIDIDIEIRLVA